MIHHQVRDEDAFLDAVRRRRRNLPIRLGVAVIAVMVFLPIIRLETALAWIGVYFAAQLLDAMAFAPANKPRPEPLPGWRRTLGAGLILISTAIYGYLSLPLWAFGGLAGGVCAVLVLAGGVINALMVSGRSPLMLTLYASPLFFYMALTPLLLLAEGAGRSEAVAVAIIIVTILAFALAAHGTNSRLTRSEQRARRDLDRRRREAEAAVADKSAYVAAVSHDLRTPLSAILTGAEELERTGEGAGRETAALIGEAGRMMKVLLDQILDHAKLEAGRMEVEPRIFNLRQTLAGTVKLWQREAAALGLRLRLEGAASVPNWVQGDDMRLRQILNNLISNALKFTQDGNVTLRIRAWDQDPDAVAFLMEIEDTGPGMDKAQLARLFTPFDQTEDGVSARHGGTGLGLAISKHLAELMGGRLTARSAKGEGAIFTLALTLPRAAAPDAAGLAEVARRDRAPQLLPLKRVSAALTPTPQELAATAPSEPAPASEPQPEPEAGPRALRVLVVDDHEINRRAVQLILAPVGAEIATAADGRAALHAAEQQTYDVIFMDVRMPELDGRETTRRIRAGDGPNRATPVIAVTADTAQDDIDACMAAGMDYFVSKPLTPAALLGALNHVLQATPPTDSVAAVA